MDADLLGLNSSKIKGRSNNMPINTDNARALVGGRGHTGKSWVRMLKGTQVHSVGRGVVKGEKVEVSEEDARYLVAYNYAERLQDPVVEREGITLTGADNKESSANPAVATEGITLTGADNKESSSSSASVNFAGIETAEPTDQRRFTRRRDRNK
jgi:hypothetical protein